MKEKIDTQGIYSLVVLRRLKATSYTPYETENFNYGAIRQSSDYKVKFDHKQHLSEYKLLAQYVVAYS
jgi:hypothetical protein